MRFVYRDGGHGGSPGSRNELAKALRRHVKQLQPVRSQRLPYRRPGLRVLGAAQIRRGDPACAEGADLILHERNQR